MFLGVKIVCLYCDFDKGSVVEGELLRLFVTGYDATTAERRGQVVRLRLSTP